MHLITTTDELTRLCEQVGHNAYVTVDTEFIRDKTYFPRLCLVQIAGEEVSALIDPLAEGIDLAPLFALLTKPDVIKVFHACRQDLEIFYMLAGIIPSPLFDSQIAASMCGYGESASYESLVNKIVGQELDKSSRFTDWSARPLSEKQLNYALSDVTHLRMIYEKLREQLQQTGRWSWIEEEHAFLHAPGLYDTQPEDAWERLKFGNMRPKHLVALRELAAWRELEARKHNVPRGRIIKDEVLVEIASVLPRKEADLQRMRSVDKSLGKTKSDAVLACIERALALPQSEWPSVPKHKKPSENISSAVAMLQLLLKVKADVHGIAAPMIASKDDLEALALGKDTPALHGWRNDVFGRKATQLMQGKLTMSLDAQGKRVVFGETL
jgi:ribonuclease D